MNNKDAAELKLIFDPLPLTKDNCLLLPELVGDTFFPLESMVLTAVPAVLAVGHGVCS